MGRWGEAVEAAGQRAADTSSVPIDEAAWKSAGFRPWYVVLSASKCGCWHAARRAVGQTVRSATFTGVAEASAARSVSLETGAPGVLVDCSHDTVGSDK